MLPVHAASKYGRRWNGAHSADRRPHRLPLTTRDQKEIDSPGEVLAAHHRLAVEFGNQAERVVADACERVQARFEKLSTKTAEQIDQRHYAPIQTALRGEAVSYDWKRETGYIESYQHRIIMAGCIPTPPGPFTTVRAYPSPVRRHLRTRAMSLNQWTRLNRVPLATPMTKDSACNVKVVSLPREHVAR